MLTLCVERQRRQRIPAIASSTTPSASSGSPQPGTSHAVMTQRPTTPPPSLESRRPRTPTPPSTPPFRHSSSSPGSAAFSPEATIRAAAVARSLGWEVSSSGSGNEEPASLLQPPTVRELMARQLRLERTAALLQQTAVILQAQVEQQGVTLRHLLGRGRR
ncbi:uncharacterized protein LOC143767030 [Ranitomeya variabilis]|uniref:uncharacterized protein LOC143767030 n=1 Tax=Ranitomeya variabilis TaxID=490064 RepID=UPI00405622B3